MTDKLESEMKELKNRKHSRKFRNIFSNVVLPAGFYVLAAFETFMAGYHLAKGNESLAVSAGIFSLLFLTLPILQYLDARMDAKFGREMLELSDRTLGLLKVLAGRLKDSAHQATDTIEDLHNDLLTRRLQVILEKGVDEAITAAGFKNHAAAKKAGWTPKDIDARKIEAEFKKETGHVVTLEWLGDGWSADIDLEHTDMDSKEQKKKGFTVETAKVTKIPVTEVKPRKPRAKKSTAAKSTKKKEKK